MFELPDIQRIVAEALAEDLGVDPEVFLGGAGSPELLERDVTTFAVVGIDARFRGRIVAREDCVVCGLPVAQAVFETLSAAAGLFEPAEMFPLVAEGATVSAGTAVADIDGLAAVVLAAERTALDFVMMLSGIATRAAEWQHAAGPAMRVCDTRKTWPGLRELSKYAVTVGGASNHRHGLYDMVLVKDNHLRHAETIAQAVQLAQESFPDLEVEVEADTLEQALEAVRAGADYVLLDNMDDATLAQAVTACREEAALRGAPVLLEASGGITRERLHSLRETGVDRVSSSALTMAPPVDFGLDEGAG